MKTTRLAANSARSGRLTTASIGRPAFHRDQNVSRLQKTRVGQKSASGSARARIRARARRRSRRREPGASTPRATLAGNCGTRRPRHDRRRQPGAPRLRSGGARSRAERGHARRGRRRSRTTRRPRPPERGRSAPPSVIDANAPSDSTTSAGDRNRREAHRAARPRAVGQSARLSDERDGKGGASGARRIRAGATVAGRPARTAAAGIAGKRYGGSLLDDTEKNTNTTANQIRKKNPSASSLRIHERRESPSEERQARQEAEQEDGRSNRRARALGGRRREALEVLVDEEELQRSPGGAARRAGTRAPRARGRRAPPGETTRTAKRGACARSPAPRRGESLPAARLRRALS